MAQVTLRINGYAYTIGCQDGEEKHLEAMGAEVNSRIDGVRAASGPSGEARMLAVSYTHLCGPAWCISPSLALPSCIAAATRSPRRCRFIRRIFRRGLASQPAVRTWSPITGPMSD